MSTSSSSNGDILKAITAGAVVVAADKFILKQSNMQSSLYFGAAAAAGIYFSGNLAKMLPDMSSMGATKTVGTRLVEVGAGSGASILINKYVLNNDYNTTQIMTKVGVVVLADVIGEYVSDYNNGRELSYF